VSDLWTDFYNPQMEGTLLWSDPIGEIGWPLPRMIAGVTLADAEAFDLARHALPRCFRQRIRSSRAHLSAHSIVALLLEPT
jgi:hypothetical protein